MADQLLLQTYQGQKSRDLTFDMLLIGENP
jgi:hypothetical protein